MPTDADTPLAKWWARRLHPPVRPNKRQRREARRVARGLPPYSELQLERAFRFAYVR